MPNQTTATAPRIGPGIWAPRMPKAMRHITGNGTPVLIPMKPDKLSRKNNRAAPMPRDTRICQPPRPSANRPRAKP